MWEIFKTNVLAPSLTRVGSATAGALVTFGMTHADANAVGVAVGVLLGWGIDLMLAWFRKRRIIARALGKLSP